MKAEQKFSTLFSATCLREEYFNYFPERSLAIENDKNSHIITHIKSSLSIEGFPPTYYTINYWNNRIYLTGLMTDGIKKLSNFGHDSRGGQ